VLEAADDTDAKADGERHEAQEADEGQRAAGLGKNRGRGRGGLGCCGLRHRARLGRRLRRGAGDTHFLFGGDGLFSVDDVRGNPVAAGKGRDGDLLAIAVERETLGNPGDLVDLTELVAIDDRLADSLENLGLADFGGLDLDGRRDGGNGLGELGARRELGDRDLLAVNLEEEVGGDIGILDGAVGHLHDEMVAVDMEHGALLDFISSGLGHGQAGAHGHHGDQGNDQVLLHRHLPLSFSWFALLGFSC